MKLQSTLGSFILDAKHPSLPGHFPGNPILPGAVLLDHALSLVDDPVTLINSVKFRHPVQSGDLCVVEKLEGPLGVTLQVWVASNLVMTIQLPAGGRNL